MVFSIGRKQRSGNSVTSRLPFAKFLGPITCLGAVAAGGILAISGRLELSSLAMFRGSSELSSSTDSTTNVTQVKLNLGQKSQTNIRIATFSIQSFGKRKSADVNVMRVLTHVISQFDVVAVQQIQGGDPGPIEAIVNSLRNSGASYNATVSQPIGQGSQSESYAFLWDDTRIQLVPDSAYVVQDTADRMYREPMVASFETRVGTADGRRPFRFTLINAHASPATVGAAAVGDEMDVLDDVYVRVRQYDYQTNGEEDCILLGNLNVDAAGLKELGQIPGVQSIAGETKTNTLGNATQDHIIIDARMTREFSGRFGVLSLVDQLGLTQEQALQVSDHQPLWGEFSIYEVPNFDALGDQSQGASAQ
ncbi:MAG: deoxyribonuclease [Planctomycetaceae bacterium]|nr:deoxyribonuclease [Planctomycetaceae bacterium]